MDSNTVSETVEGQQTAARESDANPTSTATGSTGDVPPKKRKASTGDSSHASSSRGVADDGSRHSLRGLLKKRKASADSGERNKLSVDSASLDVAKRKLSAGSVPSSRKSSAGSDDILFAKRKGSIGSSKEFRSRKTSVDSDELSSGLAALGSVASSTLSGDRVAAALRQNAPADAMSLGTRGSVLAGKALEHLDALGDEHGSLGSRAASRTKRDDDGSGSGGTLASTNQRLLMEALMYSTTGSQNRRRDRFESWGGMSDLSATGIRDDFASNDAAAAFAASALHETGILGDVTAAAGSCAASITSEISEDPANKASVPVRISVADDRSPDRKMSATELSAADGSGTTSVSGTELQAFIQAAMMSVGDQLADLAGAVEHAASGPDAGVPEAGSLGSFGSDLLRREAGLDSDISSAASPLIGAITERELAMLKSKDATGVRPRSSSTSSSRPIAVDYNAVAAAVDAAQAATTAIDLSSFVKKGSKNLKYASAKQKANPIVSVPLPESTMSGEELEARRARARAAAGYVPPSGDGAAPNSRPPIKKRPKVPTSDKPASQNQVSVSAAAQRSPVAPRAPSSAQTPKISNATNARSARSLPVPQAVPSSTGISSTKDAASLKWDEMFGCLLQFIQERKVLEQKDMSDTEKKAWKWDGNVPTTYKTKDGKGLGRWINNQRSAKTKGTLKEDREVKLCSTGLRWSVITTNPFDDMLDELKRYIKEETKDGQEWDGNVPTSYCVDGDKKLGRWVNRQRSLYQSGRLLEDRIEKLEEIGLKWSVLNNFSWYDMYEALVEYVNERKAADPNNSWDGNCPAKFETRDGKALGRWINRQRSAHTKRVLKDEYLDKLTSLGLRWAVHDRRATTANAATSAAPGGDEHRKENKHVEAVEV